MHAKLFIGWLATAAFCGLVAMAGCSASDGSSGAGAGTGTGTGSSGQGGSGGFNTGFGGNVQPDPVGSLQGTVRAPEGTIPISGALVYLTSTTPPPIPDGVFCDRCVELDFDTPFTESNADGSFDLPAYNTGTQYLVVQKGQFRRVRQFDVVEGTQPVGAALTTLPGQMDKAGGDDIPKMAILGGGWDDIGASLLKLGMQPGSFDVFEATWPPDANDPFLPDKLLHDPAVMNQYHIVFTPCESSDGTTCGYSMAEDGATHTTIAQFVDQGGKLYVTDYAYDYIREIWPEYIDWMPQNSSFGSACLPSSYDAAAQVEDQGMSDWLAAQGITNFTLEANWTMVEKVNTVSTTDYQNQPVDIAPKVWVSGQTPSDGSRPSTLSFERGCGRVLFSTYHTEGSGGSELLAQEKALLYVLLEVGVCIGTPVPR